LQYDAAGKQWLLPHHDLRIQTLAECFVQTYLAKKIPVTELSMNS